MNSNNSRQEQSIKIRDVRVADAAQVTGLLKELGYGWSIADVEQRIRSFIGEGERSLVAEEENGTLSGLLTLHVTHVLHRAGPVGRLTTMVVSESARGKGVGRALVNAGEAYLTERGCVMIEVTSNKSRTGAHAFYTALGYEETSVRFAKPVAGHASSEIH
jgi:GNAT superfamily N-acetyltransferase